MALKPTPPAPKTATEEPAPTRAVLTTAPTPYHRTTKEYGGLHWNVRVNFHDRFARDDAELRVTGHAGMMMHDATTGFAKTHAAAQQRACAIRGDARLTQCSSSRHAHRAVSACGEEGEHHRIVRAQICHAVADLEHFPASLMAEHERERPQAGAVDNRQIRVTKPGGGHLHEHLIRTRRVQVQFLDHERTALRIRRGQASFTQDRSARFHRRDFGSVISPATRPRQE